VFDHDELGHSVVPAATWSSSAGISSTFFRTFKLPIPHVVGVRHVVFPSVSIAYSPDFPSLQYRDTAGVSRNRFNSFGNIGISGSKAAGMSFAVDQRFQVKLKDGDKVTRLDNLVSWSSSGYYDFLWHEHGLKHGLSAIGNTIALQPPGFVSASMNGTVDPYQGRPLRNLGLNVGFNFSSNGARKQPAPLAAEQTARRNDIVSQEDFRETWRTSIAYSYSGGYGYQNWESNRTANGVFSYQMTPNWQFDYSALFDVTQSRLQSQRFSLTRKIHCWDAVFTRSFVPGGEAEYYFRLGVRDQKEIYYERGTRAQSFGGIQ
jgi:hypothetical protein